MPQSMQRAPCSRRPGSGSGWMYSLKSLRRSSTGRYWYASRWTRRKAPSSPMVGHSLDAGAALGGGHPVGRQPHRPHRAEVLGLALGEHALEVLRHDLDPRALEDDPVREDPLRDLGLRARVVLLDQRVDLLEVIGGRRLEVDQAHVAALVERAGTVEHVRDATGHAGREVAPGRAEHHDAPAGHVLAAVIADALDDGVHARVADREALAGQAAEERLAPGGAVEHRVADDDVLLGLVAGALGRAACQAAARHALAGVVVRVAEQRDRDARRQPGAEALAAG